MTGPENYAEAERLREHARDMMNQDKMEMAAYFNAAAQVHATLALAAATADTTLGGPTHGYGTDLESPAYYLGLRRD